MKERKSFRLGFPAFFILIYFFTTPLFARDFSDFSHKQLDNGLDLYFLEDYSSPSAAFCFAVKAGTSVQTSSSTGIAELCTRLFFSPVGGQQFFYDEGAFSVGAECSGDYALYTSCFSADYVKDILSGLSLCVMAEDFSQEELAAQYELMKEKAGEWEASSESYINGSMDEAMFPYYPWSRETGLCPEAFEAAGLEGAMSLVKEMRSSYYLPDNSALFLCGPFTAGYIFPLLESFFGAWRAGESIPLKTLWEDGVYSLADLVSWEEEGAAALQQTLQGLRLGSRRSGGGRYVLTSSSFSKEFNQLIVQYVLDNPFFSAAQAAAASTAEALFENGSRFKGLVLSDEECGIKSEDWLYTSLLRQQSGSRLVFQAIAENKDTSPEVQALAFARCIESPEVFAEDEIAYFSRITGDRLSLLRRDAYQFIHAMAVDWALCNPLLPLLAEKLQGEGLPSFSFSKSFFEPYVLPQSEAALTLTVQDLFQVLDSEPYVFLLLNDQVFEQYSSSIEGAGFVHISQDAGLWYQTEEGRLQLEAGTMPVAEEASGLSFSELVVEKAAPLLVAELTGLDRKLSEAEATGPEIVSGGAPEAEDATTEPTEAEVTNTEPEEAETADPEEPVADSPTEYSGGQSYIDYGKQAFSSSYLSNGIPVLVQNATSTSFSFRINFSGQKEVLSASERDKRLVISDVIANNIRQYILMSGLIPYSEFSVSCQSNNYGSSIDISSSSEYGEAVVSIAAEALFLGEISAPRVDECAYSRSSEWGMKLADGDFQLHSAAMAQLFENGAQAGYYDISTDFFTGLVFQDIEMEYLKMLDAACISLAIYGEDADKLLPLLEENFGFLMSFSSSGRDSPLQSSEQQLSDSQLAVVLHRIFTSSVKPGEYVAQPDKLIPTDIFYDPLHIYFQCPPVNSPDYAVFMALVYELEEILDGMWEGGVVSSFDCLYLPVAGIWFKGVSVASEVYQLFSKGLELLQRPFDDERMKALRSRYVARFCNGVESASSTTDRLMEGYFYSRDGALYLNQLETLTMASAEDFEKAAALFSSMPLLRVVSADTK